MSLRNVYVVAGILLGIMLAMSAWGLARVEPDAVVPIHWGVTGEADGFAPALVAFSMTPLIALGLLALLAVVPRIEPRRANLERSASAYRTVAIALMALMAVVHAGVVLAGIGHPVSMGTLVGGAVGVMFAVTGNVLATVRSNFQFGVRTAWTLSRDRSWDRTHRLVGRLVVMAGIAIVVLALTGVMLLVVGVLLAFIVAILVVAFGYSYREWKADPDRRPVGDGS